MHIILFLDTRDICFVHINDMRVKPDTKWFFAIGVVMIKSHCLFPCGLRIFCSFIKVKCSGNAIFWDFCGQLARMLAFLWIYRNHDLYVAFV